MKKLLALMLALMLALGCVSAVNAEDAAAGTVDAVPETAAASSGTIHLKISLNADTIAAMTGATDESAAKQAAMIVEIINALGITMTSDGKDAEMIVSANDTPVAGLGVIRNDDKMLLVSEMFPSYALAVDQNAMGSLTGGAAGSPAGGFTMPQISMSEEQMAALMEPVTKLVADLQAKVGEPEQVDEAMYGAAFTVKVPINLTTKELIQTVLPAVKEVVSQEAFTSVLEQLKAQGMKIDFSPEDIDKKIEEFSSKTDDELPVMDAAIYSNEGGDSVFALLLTQDEKALAVNAGSVAGGFVTEVGYNEDFHMLLQGAGNDMTLSMLIRTKDGMEIGIDGAASGSDEGFQADFAVKLNGSDLGTLTVDGTPGGVLSGNYSAEGRTEIAVTDLQNAENEAAQGFMKEIRTGWMMTVMKAAQVIPSVMQMMQEMTPQTQQ